jgi:hypothetical protein
METRARGVNVRGYYASLLKNKSVRISVQARRQLADVVNFRPVNSIISKTNSI